MPQNFLNNYFACYNILKANCSEFTLILICFQKLRLMRNQIPDVKIRLQGGENALNVLCIRNTFDWLLQYDNIRLFCLSRQTEILL